MLRFILAYTIALLAFWAQKIDALLRVNDTLVLLFAGQIAPVEILPQVMKNTAYILPFRYMLGFPIEALMGKLNFNEILFGLVIQLIWVCMAVILSLIVWKKGVKKYSGIGG